MVLSCAAGVAFYMLLSILITPSIQALYTTDPSVIFAPSHFNDARQYVYICSQGYTIPTDTLPTMGRSRLNWMPVYAALQCGLHALTQISLVYTGWVISIIAIGVALMFGALTLMQLGVRQPALPILVILTPIIGGAWLYLPGVEATYLAMGMIVMVAVTLPPARTPIAVILRVVLGLALGVIFFLTKPNALAFILPLLFAFFYQSWQYSRRIGYAYGFWTFIADAIMEHVRFVLRWFVQMDTRPIEYEWTPLAIAIGILLGLAYWLRLSSDMSGVPFYFLQQQTTVWGRAWPSGNLGEMLVYFAQAFRGIGASGHAWRYNAAWNLAANLSALIPAASRRVPGLIRGMLPLTVVFLLYSGAVHGSDRYILSTALVAIGWACWLAPTQDAKSRLAGHTVKSHRTAWVALRWLFVLGLFTLTSHLLVVEMFPKGEPNAWGINER